MASSHQIPLFLLGLVFLLSVFAVRLSASALLSDAVAGHQVVSERRLLQVKKRCSVDFENQNYTIITSQCKGPDYPQGPCCSSLKEFVCPFAEQINDLETDCSTTMFNYITRIGAYPPGLFSSICREGKDGLACPAPPPLASPNVGSRMLGRQLFMALLLLFPLHILV